MCKTVIIFNVNLLANRSELLRVWKKENGSNATYENLLKACVQTNNAEAANTIVELLKGNYHRT